MWSKPTIYVGQSLTVPNSVQLIAVQHKIIMESRHCAISFHKVSKSQKTQPRPNTSDAQPSRARELVEPPKTSGAAFIAVNLVGLAVEVVRPTWNLPAELKSVEKI